MDLGYGEGRLAPGLKLSAARLNQVRYYAVLGHGLAVQAIHAKGQAGRKVGPADNIHGAVPIIETVENIKAAEHATRELNAPYLTVILEGRYTDAYLKAAGPHAPKFTDADLKIISSPLDFIGINVYMPNPYVRASDKEPGIRFGLVYVDYTTQKRTPKLSASFYRETISRNAVA